MCLGILAWLYARHNSFPSTYHICHGSCIQMAKETITAVTAQLQSSSSWTAAKKSETAQEWLLLSHICSLTKQVSHEIHNIPTSGFPSWKSVHVCTNYMCAWIVSNYIEADQWHDDKDTFISRKLSTTMQRLVYETFLGMLTHFLFISLHYNVVVFFSFSKLFRWYMLNRN